MYSNIIDNLNRQKDKIDEMIRNYQAPVNNYINTNQTPQNNLIEWRILNENEEVDNLYVSNKTLFINDNLMVLKGVDGSLEKWEVKKIYPIDKKDEKINELQEEVRKLKEMIGNEHTKSNEPTREFKQPTSTNDEYIEPKSKTNGKSISK
ncbi:hypothetical protein IKS57_01725 [bacterium]|nr:hypothetical protein [bacterium]